MTLRPECQNGRECSDPGSEFCLCATLTRVEESKKRKKAFSSFSSEKEGLRTGGVSSSGSAGQSEAPAEAAAETLLSCATGPAAATTAERITAAALRTTDGRVFSEAPPARHCHVIQKMREAGCEDHDIFTATQGFTTTLGRFLHRRAAFRVAKAAQQFVREPTAPTHGLFSEDVW